MKKMGWNGRTIKNREDRTGERGNTIMRGGKVDQAEVEAEFTS